MSGGTRPSYEFGPFRLDLSEHQLLRDGRPLPLTPKAFELLRVLVQHAGHLVEKDMLLKEVWPDNFVEDGALNRTISVIRKLLGESTGRKYIETVPKVGYRFVAPVIERRAEVKAPPENRPEPSSSDIARRSRASAFLRQITWPGAGVFVALVLVVAIAVVFLRQGKGYGPQIAADPTHRRRSPATRPRYAGG